MNIGNPLTKKAYDKDDRIIARLPDRASNYLGTIIKVLPNGSYDIDYDDGFSLRTEHDQILGLTFPFNKHYPDRVLDNNLIKWLLQRVLPEHIGKIKNKLGNPQTKDVYDVGDRIIVKFEHPETAGNYYATVDGLKNDIYTVRYDEYNGLYPTEPHQILGLADQPGSKKPIADDNLKDCLSQNTKEPLNPVPPIDAPRGYERQKPDPIKENTGGEGSIERSMINGSFSVLASVLNERALTESLRYLLDSESPHSLSDKFFHELLDYANIPGIKLQNKEKFIISASSEWHTDEHKRLDILVIAKRNLCESPVIVLGIEGKVTAFESQKQLTSYQCEINKAFKAVQKKGIILITSDGHSPVTADHQNSHCPVVALSWSKIADIASSKFSHLPFALEFSEYLTRFVKPVDNLIGKKAEIFFQDNILNSIRKNLRLNENEILIAWQYPKEMPKEFNFWHNSINSILRNKANPIIFYYMFYCPRGVPIVGKQIHLLLMARKKNANNFNKNELQRLDELKEKYLPARQTGRYQWGTWQFLWSIGGATLRDMGDYDIEALTSLYDATYKLTSGKLIEGINKLFLNNIR